MKALLDTAQSARDAGIRVREAAATRTAAARAKDVVGPPEYQPVLDAALNTGYASADQAKAIRKYDKDRAKQLVSIIVPITDSSGRTTYSKDPRYEVLLKESVDPKKVSEGIGAVLALESTIGEMESIADAAGYDYITLARNPKYQALVERATVLTGRASDAGVLASEEKSQFKNFIDPSSPLNSVPFKKGFYKAFREQMFNEHRDSLEAQLIRSAPPDVRKIPADAIRELKSKPDTWKDFDAAFGAGASTEVLRAR
jgi:hypothetical protein